MEEIKQEDPHSKFMLLALQQAQFGLERGEVPVGCVFVHNQTQRVIASSHNLTNVSKNATTHCEINCIREICKQNEKELLKDCTLYVTVEPCIMCAYALNIIGIRHVVFGCENDKFGGNGSILSLHRFSREGQDFKYTIEKGVMKNEAIKLLQQFYEHGNEKAPETKRQRKI